MHEFPVVASGVTTSRRDFVKHDILTKEKQRLTSLRANKVRLLKEYCAWACILPHFPLVGEAVRVGS